jgi:hypothetical protein
MKTGEFYIGYQPRAPLATGRFLFRVTLVLLLAAGACALLLVSSLERFDPGEFAYQDFHPYRGVLTLHPYPRLDGYWLVAPGKHALPPPLAAGPVELQGALIANPQERMLEVLPGSVRATGAVPPAPRAATDGGIFSLTGEVVDTKCFFGVMKPGRGNVHRACAELCLRGGIPAGLLVRAANGEARVVLLASEEGRSLARELAPLAGYRVTVQGRLIRSHDSLILQAPLPAFVRE